MKFINNSNPPTFKARQKGVALAITLILLAVIGLSSVTAMQSGLFGSMVANNMRANQLAIQAAETALRFCERAARAAPPAIPIQPAPAINTDTPLLWNTMANWTGGAAIATTLPAAVVNSPKSNTTYAQRPQCIVESMELIRTKGAMDEVAFLITARGFSPDYRVDAGGAITNGAEVWLQSTIRETP